MSQTIRRASLYLGAGLVLFAAIVGCMIAFGGPVRPPVHAGLATDDRLIEKSLADRPALQSFRARDGSSLYYRRYPGLAGRGLVVLVHGSSGSSAAVHKLAEALSGEGVTVFAPDLRGHGASGPHGDIAYLGQLDDDMADLAAHLDQLAPNERRLLAGHSSGGGFVLRIAGGPVACRFDGFLALSPYLQHSSSTNRPDAGWASAGLPRIIGLSIINRAGLHAFDGLPVLDFAIPPDAPGRTTSYSWRLMDNFGLDMRRWQETIRAINRPTSVSIGSNDELFDAHQYPATFARLNPRIAVRVVPGVDHMGMVLNDTAIPETASAVRTMLDAPRDKRCR